MVFEDTGRMGVKKAASSFVAGLVMTLILVIAVPIVVNQYISGYVSEAVGETSFLFLTSEMLILLIIWLTERASATSSRSIDGGIDRQLIGSRVKEENDC